MWTPDPAQEALRDLTWARETAKGDLHRVRQRITNMLLRLGIEEPAGLKTRWSQDYERWLAGVRFDSREQQVVWEVLLEAKPLPKRRRIRLFPSVNRGLHAPCPQYPARLGFMVLREGLPARGFVDRQGTAGDKPLPYVLRA